MSSIHSGQSSIGFSNLRHTVLDLFNTVIFATDFHHP
jgi:hypothetical protein